MLMRHMTWILNTWHFCPQSPWMAWVQMTASRASSSFICSRHEQNTRSRTTARSSGTKFRTSREFDLMSQSLSRKPGTFSQFNLHPAGKRALPYRSGSAWVRAGACMSNDMSCSLTGPLRTRNLSGAPAGFCKVIASDNLVPGNASRKHKMGLCRNSRMYALILLAWFWEDSCL